MRGAGQRRAIADADWDSLVESRIIMLENVNAHNPEWKLHCDKRREARGLKTLIERHDLFLNNELGKAIRPSRQNRTSIMDLTFTTREIGALDS